MLDDNLLACSDEHIRAVFAMLERQHYGRPEFTGGLEAGKLKPWHVEELLKLNPAAMYFAYDDPAKYEPLVAAGRMFREQGFTNSKHNLLAYVLIGYNRDTFDKATDRLTDTIRAGFMPMAMLWMDKKGRQDPAWKLFQREWANKWIVGTKMRQTAV